MFEPIPLFTSISSLNDRYVLGRNFGPAWQIACIQSWKQSGFRPIGINSSKEIETFSLLPIEFQESPHARPRIVDMLTAAKAAGARVAGIINSDCMTIPQANLAGRLSSLLKDGLIIVERNNLSAETLRPTGKLCRGFDAFFFETSALDQITWDEHWKIGAPWWDYWFPLTFKLAGLNVRTLPAPMVLHLDHERAWSWTAYQTDFSRIVQMAAGIRNQELANLPLTVKLTDEMVESHAKNIYWWLRQHQSLWTPEYEGVDDLITSILNAVSSTAPQPNLFRMIAGQLIDALGLRSVVTRIREYRSYKIYQ